jgi:putative Holliday junction resolvase
MLLRNPSELQPLLKPNQCVLGLDYGSKVVGVAVSDPNLRIASPIASLVRKKFSDDAALLTSLMHERNIGAIIVGLPRNMDGSEGASAQAARAFVRNLLNYKDARGQQPYRDMPVLFWDERLSTAAIERFMISNDMSRKRRDETVDKAAAAYILQGALDALHNRLIS